MQGSKKNKSSQVCKVNSNRDLIRTITGLRTRHFRGMTIRRDGTRYYCLSNNCDHADWINGNEAADWHAKKTRNLNAKNNSQNTLDNANGIVRFRLRENTSKKVHRFAKSIQIEIMQQLLLA